MARKRESRRHSTTGFSQRCRTDEMTNVRSFIILQSGEGLTWSALFNICRKALGHLMKFTQCGIPYRFGLAG